MNITLYENNIFEIKNLEAEVRKLNEKIDALKDEMKKDMEINCIDTVDTSLGVVRYQDITSNRFDSSAFKKDHPDMYANYLIESVSKRFTIK